MRPAEPESNVRHRRPSIFLLLLLSMAAVLTGTVAAVSWVAIDRYTETYKENTFNNYSVLAKQVAQTTFNTFTNLNFAFLEQSLIDIAESPDIEFVEIVNSKDEIYLSSSVERRGQAIDTEKSNRAEPAPTALVKYPFTMEGMEDDWTVHVGVSLEPFRAQRREAVTAFVVTGLIILAPVLLISFLIAKYLTAPLARLVDVTRRMSEQHPEVRAKPESIYEMNELASAFNRMAGTFRLRRFLSPQVADLILSSGEEGTYLQSHRREVATLFCDLRGFTDFSETVEPEEALQVLQEYHEAMGKRISEFGGTIDHRAGDGVMVLFNDPLPCSDPAKVAVHMAIKMREDMRDLSAQWAVEGYNVGFGVGISFGFATMGVVGYEGRSDYTANGTVVNLASRLCDEAKDGQILVTQRVYAKVSSFVETESLGELSFKGIVRPTKVFNILRLACSDDTGGERRQIIDSARHEQ